ncbi:procollagen-proline 4-dioxygenase [Sarracenia purpurea var. burkii]
MATHLPILLLLAFAFCFSSVNAESGRKGLRTKEGNLENVIQLGRRIPSNRIDPSRAKGKKKNSRENGGHSEKVDTSKLPRSSEIFSSTDDDIKERVEDRISAWTFLPKENSKPFQVQHFGLEDAKAKFDYFGNKSALETNELMATVVLYLSNVSQGGQILFPESEFENYRLKKRIRPDCRNISYELRPTKGNAILFFNSHLNASLDRSSVHKRCPILEGEMWCATKFFHMRAITGEKVPFQLDSSDCSNEDENCPRWAAIGECERNPTFMIGSPDYYGTCRKSCNAC